MSALRKQRLLGEALGEKDGEMPTAEGLLVVTAPGRAAECLGPRTKREPAVTDCPDTFSVHFLGLPNWCEVSYTWARSGSLPAYSRREGGREEQRLATPHEALGAIGPEEMRQAVNAIRDTLAELRIEQLAPAHARRVAA